MADGEEEELEIKPSTSGDHLQAALTGPQVAWVSSDQRTHGYNGDQDL